MHRLVAACMLLCRTCAGKGVHCSPFSSHAVGATPDPDAALRLAPPAAAAKQAGRTQKKGKGLDAEIITSSAVSAFLKMLPTSTSWCGRPRGA